MYTDTSSCIKLNDRLSDWFHVESGVKQGDNLSPTLFSLYINDLALYINSLNKGVRIGQRPLSTLLYADDMVFISGSENGLQSMLNAMYEWSLKWRLKLNINKSKIMHFRPKRRICTLCKFTFGREVIEKVDYYKYLGVFLDF